MNTLEIKERVVEAYRDQVPEFQKVRVTEVVRDVFGGNLAVIKYKRREGGTDDEICYVDTEGWVRIFETTTELTHYLEQKAKAPLIERIFTRPVVSGVVFMFLLVAVSIIGFSTTFRPEALSILGSVVGVAAGFFFGSKPSDK